MALYISERAIRDCLPALARTGVFSDMLSARYVAPDAASTSYTFSPPTGIDSPFPEAIAVLSGLRRRDCDPATAGWRLHDCYLSEDAPLSFFPFARGSEPRQRESRWKVGGRSFARSGLQSRLSDGKAPGRGVLSYRPEPAQGLQRLELAADYTTAIYKDALSREGPIRLWDFAAWALRFVPIPVDDPAGALRWASDTVVSEFRLSADQLADSRDDALRKSAWFYRLPKPDPATYLTDEPIGEAALEAICLAHDARRGGGAPAQRGAQDGAGAGAVDAGREEEEEEGPLDLYEVLLDAGGGRKLRIPRDVLESVVAHTRSGKHLLLIGPPGTGKSTLAKNLVEAARLRLVPEIAAPAGSLFTTATASWTSFDTIGGYVPGRRGDLEFRPNVFLSGFASNRWVVVDELNRADVDKAFGPMLTVLAGLHAPLDLPYEAEVAGEGQEGPDVVRVCILPETWPEPGDPDRYRYKVPEGWRMVATMNTYDKNSLFRLSYAFLRRFALVYVDALPVEEAAELAFGRIGAALDAVRRARIAAALELAAAAGRPLGPAIAVDVARFVATRDAMARGGPDAADEALPPGEEEGGDGAEPELGPGGDDPAVAAEGGRPRGGEATADPLLDALVAFVLPQMDGLEPDKLRELRDGFAGRVVEPGSAARLRRYFEQMLDLPS